MTLIIMETQDVLIMGIQEIFDSRDELCKRFQLTSKEIDVIFLLAEGYSLSEIAKFSQRSIKTISTYKVSAYKKLAVKHDTLLYPRLLEYIRYLRTRST